MTTVAVWNSARREEALEHRFSASPEEVRRAAGYPLSRWYLRPWAGRASQWLAPTRLRPWHLTLLGLAAAMAAASAVVWWPAPGWLAAGLVLAAWFFDRADGQLARCQHTVSPLGAWLDANVDELGDLGLHVAVAWAAAAQTHGRLPWICLVAFLAGKYLLMHGLATEEALWPVAGPLLWPVSDRATPPTAGFPQLGKSAEARQAAGLAADAVSSSRQRRRAGAPPGGGPADRLADGGAGPGGRVLQPAVDRALRVAGAVLGRCPMSGWPTVTATIIALDEERNLSELLPRLDWVDEIVVVDGGSRDGTVQVARHYGARVGRRAFDRFDAQRNYACGQARCDWVFAVDADERPTPALAAEIRQRIATERLAAYHVPVRSTIFGRPLRRSGTQSDRPVRLWRRGCGRWTGEVHETLAVRGAVGRLDNWLEHRTIPDLEAFLAKMQRYTSLEAAARVARGQTPRWAEAWLAPPREVFRRLIWKQGLLDGPAGWAFCLLSGLSAWVEAREHRRLWRQRAGAAPHVPHPRICIRG